MAVLRPGDGHRMDGGCWSGDAGPAVVGRKTRRRGIRPAPLRLTPGSEGYRARIRTTPVSQPSGVWRSTTTVTMSPLWMPSSAARIRARARRLAVDLHDEIGIALGADSFR